MHLRRIEVEGYRASANSPIVCELPGRLSRIRRAKGGGSAPHKEAHHRAPPPPFLWGGGGVARRPPRWCH